MNRVTVLSKYKLEGYRVLITMYISRRFRHTKSRTYRLQRTSLSTSTSKSAFFEARLSIPPILYAIGHRKG